MHHSEEMGNSGELYYMYVFKIIAIWRRVRYEILIITERKLKRRLLVK